MEITSELVKKLIAQQFPQWRHLEIYPVEMSGHDNRTFHLGKEMSIRLPSGKAYASQIAKENQWLPYLQERLDYPVSSPIATGQPDEKFPYPWSVNRWIEGKTLLSITLEDKTALAKELSAALKKLQAVSSLGGPKAGSHNFYRGGDLRLYQKETMAALRNLENCLPTDILLAIWRQCIASVYTEEDVWVHGDIAPGNILMKDGHFYALIDFGILGVGDPACDYAMAWTYFDKNTRKYFLEGLSKGMIQRAKGWALWKALITYDDENQDISDNAKRTIQEILNE